MNKKLAFLCVMFVLAAASAYAQGSSARQQVALQLAPAIEISNKISISATGGEFSVKANKQFNISVSTENATDGLLLAIKNNETGGMASEGFTAYAPVRASAQGLLTNCAYGNDQSFAVNYKAKSRDAVLVYTATQP